MKKIYLVSIIIIITLIILPLLLLNTEPNVASSIDNKILAENPFSAEVRNRPNADLTKDIDSYINDRIGYRDTMILSNILINDFLFDRMDHPTYAYGKDGYIFFKNQFPIQFNEYHMAFINMVKAIKNYCDERNVPFIFVFNPVKNSVYPEFLPKGLNYNTDAIDRFISELDECDVDYVNNTPLLIDLKNEGIQVFNKKYNAGHWNDLGAFYGVNNILAHVKKYFPQIQLNKLDDFNITYTTNTSLPVSKFPINEEEPIFSLKNKIIDNTSIYDKETLRHPSFHHFSYIENPVNKIEGNPKTLVFQGSYMNGMGYKFLRNSLSEYIAIHDYQNILDLPYYFNLFKPECVIFEVAEYTLSDYYFDYEKMQELDWNPYLNSYYNDEFKINTYSLDKANVQTERGNVFTKINWTSTHLYDYVWILIDNEEFDAKLLDAANQTYQVTIPNTILDKYNQEYSIVGTLNKNLDIYQL